MALDARRVWRVDQSPAGSRDRARDRRWRQRAAPAPARPSFAPPSTACLPLQLFVVGDAAGDRAHDVERVERRHARPRLRRHRFAGTRATAARSPRRSPGGAAAARSWRGLPASAARLPAARASPRRAASGLRAASAETSARRVRARRRPGTRARAPGAGCRRTPRHSDARGGSILDACSSRSARTSRTSSSDDRADGAHRPQLCEDAQHARGFSQNHRARAPRTRRASLPTSPRQARPRARR